MIFIKLELKYLLLFLFMLLCQFSFGQENKGKDMKASILLDIGIPSAISNNTFDKNFTGDYDISLAGDIVLLHNFFIGAATAYALYDNNSRRSNPILITNNMLSTGIYAGYRQVIFAETFVQASFMMGYSWLYYKNTDKDNDTTLKSNTDARNTKVALQLIFPLEDKFMLGTHIAYGKIYSFFNPINVNIAGIKDNTPIQYISFGFSVLYQL